MKVIIAAGGTGGHIFPALSVALEWRRQNPDVELLWVGTTRNRERELCKEHGIRIVTISVRGFDRKPNLKALQAAAAFGRSVMRMSSLIRREKPDAILAFGGYVSAPVLMAARLGTTPFYMHEQNTVPGMVTRMFSNAAKCTFLGFPLSDKWELRGRSVVVGTPVRRVRGPYHDSDYPAELDRSKKTILISGGSQGSLTVSRQLVEPVQRWLQKGLQVVWHTGEAGYEEIKVKVADMPGAFLFSTIPNLYPYYALARVVVGRAGASTLAEISYFGLPCVVVPLPWASENHQWTNAGLAEGQGWAVRVAQDEQCGANVEQAVNRILEDDAAHEKMSQKALDHTPDGAASVIVESIEAAVNSKRKKVYGKRAV